jgi:DNA-binding MarR family transcriptional regulator
MANAMHSEIVREVAELQVELKKRQWLSALRWRQRMKTCLASSGIGFTEWLVLDATWSLVDRTGDAVSENEVAKALELDAMTIWHALAVLDHRELVSRGCSMSGKAWRLFVTGKGADLLRAVKPVVERASALSP